MTITVNVDLRNIIQVTGTGASGSFRLPTKKAAKASEGEKKPKKAVPKKAATKKAAPKKAAAEKSPKKKAAPKKKVAKK